MKPCTRCSSYAINFHLHGREWDSTDTDLCDVCYWRKRAEAALTPPEGYVLVPVEPTDAMLEAVPTSSHLRLREEVKRIALGEWRKMVAARPEVP